MAGAYDLTSETYQAASEIEAVEWLIEQGMTDGLPVIPPTPERVYAMLDTVPLPPDEVVGTIPERARVITVEKVAINAVMAGCRPEYFPVVVAAVRAVCDPRFSIHGPSATTSGTAVLTIVNGPIRNELKYNAKANLFGPGNRANATTGRAIYLTLRNVGGARPEEFDRACFTHPGRYTYCIAENEEASPWEPFHVSRGFEPDESTVTVFAAQAPLQVHNDSGQTPEQILSTIAKRMAAPGALRRSRDGEAVIIFAYEHMNVLAKHGWSRRDAQQFLFEEAYMTADQLVEAGLIVPELEPDEDPQRLRLFKTPDSLHLIMAGGEAGGWSVVIPGWVARHSCQAVTMGIPGYAQPASCEIPSLT